MLDVETAMKKQIAKEKNIVLGAWKTLIEHVQEVINHPVDPLPSSISIPNTIDGKTIRLTLNIDQIYPQESDNSQGSHEGN